MSSAISASPSAAASTARHHHDAPQQLLPSGFRLSRVKRGSAVVARAGPGLLTEIEPDLHEDPIDRWRTNGISPEDFEYGVYDGHHTYFGSQASTKLIDGRYSLIGFTHHDVKRGNSFMLSEEVPSNSSEVVLVHKSTQHTESR